jgi:phosphate transport system substrate-binding protein
MKAQSLGRFRTTLAGLALLGAVGVVGCGPSGGGEGESAGPTIIQNKGSDTMVNVAQVWAETYRSVAPDVEVEVSGGGSGVGIAALIRGTVDMANASRDMKPEEMESAEKNTGKKPKEFTVGYDALAVYVHKDNPIEEIELSKLAQIYVQNHDYALGSRDLNGSKEVVELVGSTPTAIGYSGMGYATDRVKMLRLASEDGAPAYEPSVENTNNHTYPLARPLHIYTLGEPEGALKAYVEWILSPAGQKVVEDSGYVPLATSAAPAADASPEGADAAGDESAEH